MVLEIPYGCERGPYALGSYPAVELIATRKARDTVKLQKAGGVDLVQARKVEKLKATNPAGDTFKVVALEWFGKQKPQWSDAYAECVFHAMADTIPG